MEVTFRLGKMAGVFALAGMLSAPAMALDMQGFSTPGDEACALNAACSLARGGVSDVMTVYGPNGAVVDRIFAFANEEALNLYYFDPALIAANAAQFGNYTQILENTGSAVLSDVYGVADIGSFANPLFVLGFASDEPIPFPPIPGLTTYIEIPGPGVPWVLEPREHMTIQYDATLYLDPALQAAGFTATFQTDVPEPASISLLGLAFAGLGLGARRGRGVRAMV